MSVRVFAAHIHYLTVVNSRVPLSPTHRVWQRATSGFTGFTGFTANRRLESTLRVGAKYLSALFLLSVGQGLAALYSYRNDSRGRLVHPDGPTMGKEEYSCIRSGGGNSHCKNDEESGPEPSLASGFVNLLLQFVVDNQSLVDKKTHSITSDDIANKESEKTKPIPSLLSKVQSKSKSTPISEDPIRVLVVGDSLAIGVGCVNRFSSTIETGTGSQLSPSKQGPVFPQTLARTLSGHFKQTVCWRSAGVDGGGIHDIGLLTRDVVKEESTKRGGVDIVVVLFGMNDLKRLLVDDFFYSRTRDNKSGLKHFCNGIERLLSDINSHAPGAIVVFPEMPIKTRTVPLGYLLEFVVGIWEQLKKIVAKRKRNVIFLDLNGKEIEILFSNSNGDAAATRSNEDTFLSADGVHPNKACYQVWATLVGGKLFRRIQQQKEFGEFQ